MDPAHTILVVASHEGLRRSIAFALEADGFNVVSERRLADVNLRDLAPFACALVDEDTVDMGDGGWALLNQFAFPVVLLTGGIGSVPEAFAKSQLTKPLLGKTLVDMVAAIVSKRGVAAPAT